MKPQDLRRQSKDTKRQINQAAAKKLFAQIQEKCEQPYSAFTASSGSRTLRWLQVYLSNEGGREFSASYSSLTSMTADSLWNSIVLKFSNCSSIVVSGHNLQPLYNRLLRHEVECIRTFNPKIWKSPRLGDPCVLGIDIRRALH